VNTKISLLSKKAYALRLYSTFNKCLEKHKISYTHQTKTERILQEKVTKNQE